MADDDGHRGKRRRLEAATSPAQASESMVVDGGCAISATVASKDADDVVCFGTV